MDQGVWLGAVQVVTVGQPEVDEHEGIEAEAEGVLVSTVAQRKEGTNDHPAKYAGSDGDAFSPV